MSQWKLGALLVAGSLGLGACNDAPAPLAPGEASLAVAKVASQKVAGRHVFTMHGNRAPSEIAADIAAAGGTVRYSMDDIGVVLVSGLSDAAAAKIASGKAVVANDLQANWVRDMTAASLRPMPLDALAGIEALSLLPPQAAAFKAYQWNMRITDTDDAWAQGKTGIPSMRVAILDSGLDAYHIDQFGLIDTQRSFAFVPSKTGPPAWEDDFFHGTYVGGIVTSNNIGVAGVAPNVTLVAVKVLDEHGNGTLGDIIAGIYYAANVGGIDVINMSLGASFAKNEGQGIVPAFNKAVNYAHSKGIFIVAASGNDGEDLQHNGNRISVPCETGVLSCISATASNDNLAYYSNYGTNAINNAAPGGDMTQGLGSPFGGVLSLCTTHSTDPALAFCKQVDTPLGFLGANYVFGEGTSGAAPHVAGLGALLDSQPMYAGSLNGSQILTMIQQNADDLGKPGADAYYGKGRMNTCRTIPGCAPVANPAPTP